MPHTPSIKQLLPSTKVSDWTSGNIVLPKEGLVAYNPDALEIISSTETTGTTVHTISSIPQTYRALHLIIFSSGTGNTNHLLTINNNTETKYARGQVYYTGSTTINPSGGYSYTSHYLGNNQSNAAASYWWFHNYSSDSERKTMSGSYTGNTLNASGEQGYFDGVWLDNTAITRLDITKGSAETMRVTLYGVL
jgi:hypothetical protein